MYVENRDEWRFRSRVANPNWKKNEVEEEDNLFIAGFANIIIMLQSCADTKKNSMGELQPPLP
jgi:hypothetical protein